jgi:hypothetical protein
MLARRPFTLWPNFLCFRTVRYIYLPVPVPPAVTPIFRVLLMFRNFRIAPVRKLSLIHMDYRGFEGSGGGGGIRTHDTLARMPVFKTGLFNHSSTPPDCGLVGSCRTMHQAGAVCNLMFETQLCSSLIVAAAFKARVDARSFSRIA